MFSLLRRREERRVIDAGCVSCPLRERDVETDACLECGWAREVAAHAQTPFVRCRPPARLLLLP